MSRVELRHNAAEIAMAENEDAIKQALLDHANQIAGRIQLPLSAGITVLTRAGKSDRSLYAQTIMRGRAALAIEFGTRRTAPLAPLRRAARGGS